MLNSRGKSGYPYLIPDLRGRPFKVSLLSMMLAASLTLLIQSLLVPVVQGVLQPHLCVLGFSQWCHVLEELLVLFVRGTKVKDTYVTTSGDVMPHY